MATNTVNIKALRRDPNAAIVDTETKKFIQRRIAENLIPDDSFLREFEGKMLHFLEKTKNGAYRVITPHPKLENNKSPLDLFIAKHCADEVAETYGMSTSTWHKIGIGVLVLLILAIIVVIFLMVTAASGGTVQ